MNITFKWLIELWFDGTVNYHWAAYAFGADPIKTVIFTAPKAPIGYYGDMLSGG